MKISIALSLLILAVAALFGWRDHTVLSSLRAENFRLAGEAAAMGIDPDDSVQAGHGSKRQRADRIEAARIVALDIIGLAKELERINESGGNHGVAMQDRALKALESLGSLDTSQLKTLIEEFRDADGLTENMRTALLSFALKALIERNPEDALGLLSQAQAFPLDGSMRSSLVASSLSKWSETAPGEALAWVASNSPDATSKVLMQAALIEGAAKTDLRIALRWIGEFGVPDAQAVVSGIAGDLDSPAERSDLLRLMKGQPETFGQKEINGALAAMGKEIGKSGYGEGARWIKENGFSESEILNLIGGGMVSQAKGGDKGRWVEWMGDNLSGERREHFIGTNVAEWTKKDHRAAGEWLAALPDGPAKAPAVEAFAKTVAPYDADIAERWAMTIPPGNQREEILREVESIRADGKAAE